MEEALENKPILKETMGRIFGVFIPLHIHISEIDSVHMDETGKINLNLSHHRKVAIPLEHKEDAEKLLEKLNELISKSESEKIQERKAERTAAAENSTK